MITEKQRLLNYLKKQGFRTSPNLATLSLIPHHYKTTGDSHVLISGIGCSYFTGAEQQNGDIGCVCFFYAGTMRLKHHRQVNQAELVKHTSVYANASDVISSFETWRKEAAQIIAEWKLII